MDQETGAGPPAVSVALNCSEVPPRAVVELQPVQLVSSRAVPGEMEKEALEEVAATRPRLQPAMSSRAGAASRARRYTRLTADGWRNGFANGVTCCNVLSAFLGSDPAHDEQDETGSSCFALSL